MRGNGRPFGVWETLLPRPVTITLTRFAESDALVRKTIAHALAQQRVDGEVLFIDQKPASAVSEADFAVGSLTLNIVRRGLAGLSAARNLALAEAAHDLVLYLDADALADPEWAAGLAEALEQPTVAVAGCRIEPGWPADPPIYARAQVLRDQYSLLELGEGTFPLGRVVGAGFGVDRSKLPPGLVFDDRLGRRDGRLFGGEESDFCRRVRDIGLEVLYVGSARVEHLVPPERLRLGWVIKRMIYAGHGRALQGGAPSPSSRPNIADWLFLPLYFPPYALGWLWGKLSR